MSNINTNGIIRNGNLRYAPMTPPRPSPTSAKQLVAVATAAIPVVMLSSLALASPATAAPTQIKPHGSHGTLDAQKVLAAVKARTASSHIPAAVVASSVPRTVSTQAVSARAVSTPVVKAQAVRAQASASSTHTVAAGDTVSGIAATFGVSVESVLALNKISASTIIHPGKVLTISGSGAPAGESSSPASSTQSHTVRAGETLSGISAQYGVSLESVYALNSLTGSSIIQPGQEIKVSGETAEAPQVTENVAVPASGNQYVIKAGDTLSAIAAKNDVSLASLVAANGGDAKSAIYPGKTLSIPGLTAASSDIVPITPAESGTAASTAELTPEQQVPSTFLHYTYPEAVVSDANVNKSALLAAPAPSRAQMKEMVARTAAAMGVDPALAMAFAQQESGFNHQSVSPANAIGTMQVIPDAGEWASGLVGRTLNLLDPQDNVTAGVAIIRALHSGAPNEDQAIAGYYQGQYSVSVHGMFNDTVNYVAGIKANRELFR
ncbi:lytic transglycosylase [Arthrobacter antibioticus]|uniref:lytic transglycosylase n=1 Tax=Arthrobacter sp. H35-MC1 TaxID=3046203 RepID=UPI0032D93F5F